MVTIPVANAPHQIMTVTLDGQPYRFTFIYNSREDRWYMSIGNSSGEVIVAGIKLVVSNELIRQYEAYDLPPGAMYVISTHSPYAEPDRNSFVDQLYNVVYVTQAEWDAGVRP
jgi:hypothetical protein